MAYFTGGDLSLEKLNLYVGKKKVLKLSSFLTLLLICLLPAVSFFFFSAQWKVLKTNDLLERYPVVFNNLSELSLGKIEDQVETLNLSFQKRINNLRDANNLLRDYLIRSYTSSYFLKYMSKLSSEVPNKIYISTALYDGHRLYMEFYEYGTETRVSTSTVQEDLSRFYGNVLVNLIEERNFIGSTKYFHYVVEGTR